MDLYLLYCLYALVTMAVILVAALTINLMRFFYKDWKNND